jgi:hypothetical protein
MNPFFLVQFARTAARTVAKIPWFRTAAYATATLAVTAAAQALIDKILKNNELLFDDKLNRLEQLKASGKISNEECAAGRKSLFETYSQHKHK